MKIKIKNLALIISGILLLPAAGYAHTQEEINKHMDIGKAHGIISASCLYLMAGFITRDEAATGIRVAFKEIKKLGASKVLDATIRATNKRYTTCKSAYPERFR